MQGNISYCLILASLGVGVSAYFDESMLYGTVSLKNLNTSEEGASYDYTQALFGPQVPIKDHFKGILHQAVPNDGCGTIVPPPTGVPLPWIAVIKRSPKNVPWNCNFADKVLNAQKSGYKAVIVYNNIIGEEERLRMNTDNSTLARLIVIPSVFVDYNAGISMCSESFPDEQNYMISAELKPLRTPGDMDPYKILIPMAFSFVGILLIAITVMVVRWVQTIRRKQRSRISKGQLKKLPLVKYKKGDQYDCCAICLDDYEEGEKVRLLPCAHTYHQKCIDPWLLKNKKTCPVCKRRVIPKPPRRRGRRHSDSSESDGTTSTGGERSSERTPLLPPPAGPRRSSVTQFLGAAGGAQYGTSMETPSTRRSGRRTAQRQRDTVAAVPPTHTALDHSSSSDEISDSENDLRRSILVQVSLTPQTYVEVGHRLNSFPTRSGFDQSPDSSLPTDNPQQGDTLSDVVSDHLVVRSHDLVDVEAPSPARTSSSTDALFMDDDRAPLISNNIIV